MKLLSSFRHGLLAFALALAPATLLSAQPPGNGTNDVDELHGAPATAIEAVAPRLGEPVNDRGLYRFLQVEGTKLVESGGTLTSWSNAKLSFQSCGLKLPSAPSHTLSGAELARRIESGVAVVGTFYLCEKCSKLHAAVATGFFVSSSGALVTSRHVLGHYVKNGRGVVVLTRDGRLCPVRDVVAADPGSDLLVLQVEGRGFTPLPIAQSPAAQGSQVFVLSHPESHFYYLGAGIVSRPGFVDNQGHTWMSVTADFAKGSSGAPVFNEAGAVVGIVNNTESIYYTVEKDQQKNLQMVLRNCTPAAPLLDLLGARTGKGNKRK